MVVLAYPKARALAQQRQLLLALAAMTLIGLVLVGLATWRAAGRITRPLVRLDEAAARFAAGEHAQVCVEGHDELARLSRKQADAYLATQRLAAGLQPFYIVLMTAGVVLLVWQASERVLDEIVVRRRKRVQVVTERDLAYSVLSPAPGLSRV